MTPILVGILKMITLLWKQPNLMSISNYYKQLKTKLNGTIFQDELINHDIL